MTHDTQAVPAHRAYSAQEAAEVPYYAHTRAGEPEESWELLADHLREVATRARSFADEFESGEWGYLAGLWHDIGKYHPDFQRKLRGERIQVEHAGAGAVLAAQIGANPLSFVIAGHHAGLANRQAHGGVLTPLVERLRRQREALGHIGPLAPPELMGNACPPVPPFLRQLGHSREAALAQELWIRFLFSALVDADRLATEAFYSRDARAAIREFDSIQVLRSRLDEHVSSFLADTLINKYRADVLTKCMAAASFPQGHFSLTVPTGGGKTLSGLAFALRHAEAHGLRRVIVVVPYTSIIEQTARVYKEVLGAKNVVEHHSALDEERALEESGENEVRRRLAVDNWDAPLVVTTSVQFFETLFSNRPSRCRKLHNVARSVVIVDEAQTIPADFLLCILDGMRELVRSYRCTLVLSTATQPALRKRDALPEGLEDVHEIVDSQDQLARAFKRVRFRWPAAGETPTPYRDIAAQLAEHDRGLAIVHLRRDARDLATRLPADGRFHLSALMCAAHRADVLERVRAALTSGGTCRLVATQLVEAGVDIDFPVVYRALAGLDSVAQAAGRCNREGRLVDESGNPCHGIVHVFRAETAPPPGTLRMGVEMTEVLLTRHGQGLDCMEGGIIEEYFRGFFHIAHLDSKHVMRHREGFDFEMVGRLLKFVDDSYSRPIVVPWGEAAIRAQRLLQQPSREAFRAIQPYVVEVRPGDLTVLEELGAVQPLEGFGHILVEPYLHLYDSNFGLIVEKEAAPNAGALIS